jgi:hypothetical protein
LIRQYLKHHPFDVASPDFSTSSEPDPDLVQDVVEVDPLNEDEKLYQILASDFEPAPEMSYGHSKSAKPVAELVRLVPSASGLVWEVRVEGGKRVTRRGHAVVKSQRPDLILGYMKSFLPQ